jgi:hypothetical protein
MPYVFRESVNASESQPCGLPSGRDVLRIVVELLVTVSLPAAASPGRFLV